MKVVRFYIGTPSLLLLLLLLLPQRTSTASFWWDRMPERMSEVRKLCLACQSVFRIPDRMSEHFRTNVRWNAKSCQILCPIECQKYQICQKRHVRRYNRNNYVRRLCQCGDHLKKVIGPPSPVDPQGLPRFQWSARRAAGLCGLCTQQFPMAHPIKLRRLRSGFLHQAMVGTINWKSWLVIEVIKVIVCRVFQPCWTTVM